MNDRTLFAVLPGGGPVWAVAAVHGEVERLHELHRQLYGRLREGHRLVYLGNYVGRGVAARETVDHLLLFRRAIMAYRGFSGEDIVYLRGAQEEMWQKLLQLQFATNPGQVLQWMVDQGVGATVAAYGASVHDAFAAAREGTVALTRWTSGLRERMRANDGHVALLSVLRHAAYTDDNALLFVHAGVDPARPLAAQRDSFWWGAAGFAALNKPYAGFRRVIRGYDPAHGGLSAGASATTIDAGCGFGGPLVAACFDATGEAIDVIQA